MLFCLCLVLSAAAHAAPRVILVFGDSLSAGYGLRVEEAWPTLLDARLRSEKLDYTVVNASISGETGPRCPAIRPGSRACYSR